MSEQMTCPHNTAMLVVCVTRKFDARGRGNRQTWRCDHCGAQIFKEDGEITNIKLPAPPQED